MARVYPVNYKYIICLNISKYHVLHWTQWPLAALDSKPWRPLRREKKRLGRTGQSQMLRLLVIPVMGYEDVEL